MDRLKLFENLNEDFFKSVLDHMFEGIQIIDNDWRYVYVNDAAASHGRRPKSEIIGKTMMEVYPGIENTEVFSRMKQCLEKSTPTQMENRFEYPDKKIGWFQLSIEPTVAGLLIRSIDISKVKQSEDFFRVAVDAAPNAMIMVNSRGKIVLANKMAEQLFGYSFAELLQMIVDQLVPIRTQGEHPQLREEFMRNPSARAMGSNRDLFCLTKDGKEVPVEIGLTPVHLDEELYVISSIVDIRERKRAEENIHRQTKELERINGELEEFFYVAAHDLRAPLRHISSFTSLLKEHMANGGDEKANKWLQYVIDGTERMRMLLDDLMHYSQADQKAVNLESVDLNKVLSETLLDLSEDVTKRKAEIKSESLPVIHGDRVKIRQVLQNLIQNALKFSAEDKQAVITVSAEDLPREWKISVADNGIGIKEEFYLQIFKPFQRLHRKRDLPGMGMGLAICKKIVELFGGQITVRSVMGQGSTFSFTIPKPPQGG